jgi:hypothetical protein
MAQGSTDCGCPGGYIYLLFKLLRSGSPGYGYKRGGMGASKESCGLILSPFKIACAVSSSVQRIYHGYLHFQMETVDTYSGRNGAGEISVHDRGF